MKKAIDVIINAKEEMARVNKNTSSEVIISSINNPGGVQVYKGIERLAEEVPEEIQMYIRNYAKDDPIGDAEEAQVDERPYINCVLCDEPIYKRTEIYDGEDYYDTPDGEICQECVSGWVDQFRKECV